MDKHKINKSLKSHLEKLGWRAITTVVLTLTAVATVWAYAAFVEPSAGPNDSDQDFAQNILGANTPDNDFDSSSVAANEDGSIIEKLEYMQRQIGTHADATSTPSAADSVFAALKGLSRIRECSESDPIGTICGGGMKFASGLVAMPGGCTDSTATEKVICNGATDSVTKRWSAAAGYNEPADSTTDGWFNTGNLVYDTLQINPAAQYCYEMDYKGYNDWYLPAKNELDSLYLRKTMVGGFAGAYYWSSTENSSNDAWLENFNDGGKMGTSKNSVLRVRCIRKY